MVSQNCLAVSQSLQTFVEAVVHCSLMYKFKNWRSLEIA